MKFVGPLFRSRNTTVRESELIVFLMPEIVAFDHCPSQREYLAQETVNCRLDRVPMAEGCGGPTSAGNGCIDCTEQYPGDAVYQSPAGVPAESMPITDTPPQEVLTPAYSQTEKVPLRAGFGDRYRAKGGTDQQRRMVRESNSQASRSVKRDSQNLLDLLKSQR